MIASKSARDRPSAYTRRIGSVPLALTMTHLPSPRPTFTPSVVSASGWPDAMADKATRATSSEPHGTLFFAVNYGGRAAAAPDSAESRPDASRSRTSASVMAPSRTALCLPYMNPPFSSNPTSAPRPAISRETSTLPTLVRTTLEFEAAATDSMADPE